MQEALEMVCRKCKITHSKEWALLLRDPQILIPLDRTVASLQGKSDLVLVMRSMLPQYGLQIDGDRRTARTTDPNGTLPPVFFGSVRFKSLSQLLFSSVCPKCLR